MLAYRTRAIYQRYTSEQMLTRICFVRRLAIVIVYSFCWTVSNKSPKSSSVSSRIWEGVLVIIHTRCTLWGRLFIMTYAMSMRHDCNRSSLRWPKAFLTVVLYTTLTLIWNSECMRSLYNRPCALSWWALITVGKILVLMMRQLILKRIVFPFVVQFHRNPSFSFLAVGKVTVAGSCGRLSYCCRVLLTAPFLLRACFRRVYWRLAWPLSSLDLFHDKRDQHRASSLCSFNYIVRQDS